MLTAVALQLEVYLTLASFLVEVAYCEAREGGFRSGEVDESGVEWPHALGGVERGGSVEVDCAFTEGPDAGRPREELVCFLGCEGLPTEV